MTDYKLQTIYCPFKVTGRIPMKFFEDIDFPDFIIERVNAAKNCDNAFITNDELLGPGDYIIVCSLVTNAAADDSSVPSKQEEVFNFNPSSANVDEFAPIEVTSVGCYFVTDVNKNCTDIGELITNGGKFNIILSTLATNDEEYDILVDSGFNNVLLKKIFENEQLFVKEGAFRNIK